MSLIARYRRAYHWYWHDWYWSVVVGWHSWYRQIGIGIVQLPPPQMRPRRHRWIWFESNGSCGTVWRIMWLQVQSDRVGDA